MSRPTTIWELVSRNTNYKRSRGEASVVEICSEPCVLPETAAADRLTDTHTPIKTRGWCAFLSPFKNDAWLCTPDLTQFCEHQSAQQNFTFQGKMLFFFLPRTAFTLKQLSRLNWSFEWARVSALTLHQTRKLVCCVCAVVALHFWNVRSDAGKVTWRGFKLFKYATWEPVSTHWCAHHGEQTKTEFPILYYLRQF